MSVHKSVLQFLDLGCIDCLEMNQGYLSEVSTLLAEMIHLNNLSLSHISFKYFKGENFRNFLIQLGQLNILQELNLSFFCLTDQLHKLLRWRSGEEPGFPEHSIVKTEETILGYPGSSNLFLLPHQHGHWQEFETGQASEKYLIVRRQTIFEKKAVLLHSFIHSVDYVQTVW